MANCYSSVFILPGWLLLYLLRGNHDLRGKAFYQSLVITLVKYPLSAEYGYNLKLVFSHCQIVPLPPNLPNLHGHIHNNPAPELGLRHINMSIEVREYRPWRLGAVICKQKTVNSGENDIVSPYLIPTGVDSSTLTCRRSICTNMLLHCGIVQTLSCRFCV